MPESTDIAPMGLETMLSTEEAKNSPLAEQNASEGALRLDINIEHDVYIAGTVNIVRLLISNPYERAIVITHVRTPQTSSFDEYREKSLEQKTSGSDLLSSFARGFAAVATLSMPGITIEIPKLNRDLLINAAPGSTVTVDQPLNEFRDVIVNAEENAQVVLSKIEKTSNGERDSQEFISVQGRSTVVIAVAVKTRQWLLFTPQRFGLNIEIGYRAGDIMRTQVIDTQMDIRPPLKSMIAGAVVGGLLGSLVASLNKPGFELYSAALNSITAVLMSVIAAVSLCRRGNTQAFITVEDFFGAFFVGSLIGYGGVAYFERAIIPPNTR